MSSISNSADFLRLLREDPEFRAEVRRELLTEELIELPEKFAAFVAQTRQEFSAIIARLERLENIVAGLVESSKRHEAALARLAETAERHEAALARLAETAERHEATLARHEAILAELVESSKRHEAILERLAETAERHEAILAELVESSKRHEAILERLAETAERHEAILAELVESSKRHEAILERLAETAERHEATLAKLVESSERHESDLARLAETAERHESDLARHEATMARLEKIIEWHDASIVRLDGSLGRLEGEQYERHVSRTLTGTVSRVIGLRRGRVVHSAAFGTSPEFHDQMDAIVEEDHITDEQWYELMNTDAILRARQGERTVYAVAEISLTVHEEDILRAEERAAILQQATGSTAYPIVIGGHIPQPQMAQADARNVHVINVQQRGQ